jgi:hypothetical protein
MCKCLLRLSAILLLACVARPAFADRGYFLVSVHCSPEIGLFELETFLLYDLDKVPDPSKGVYLLRDFAQQATISCPVGTSSLQVVVTKYRPTRDRGECFASDDAALSIQLNGNEIDTVKSTHGGCAWDDFKLHYHHIRAAPAFYTHCRTDFDVNKLFIGSGPWVTETECNHGSPSR